MIDRVCANVRNYFERDAAGNRLVYPGTYTIENGSISLPFLQPGQYFRIVGSALNDGVYKYPVYVLTDETFRGCVWEMRPPLSFLQLVDEIEAWQTKYGETAVNPYTSENVIGVYSYSKAGSGADWQQIFKSRLNAYRCL